MEEPSTKYILLRDRVGSTLERSMLSFGLTTKTTPIQLLGMRGEILEAVAEGEQPRDLNRIALVGIERKSLQLECHTKDLARLTNIDAYLLLAISLSESRYQTFIDRKPLAFGRQLLPGSNFFVKVKGLSKDVPGAVRYKGELPPNHGTWFGVELIKNPGQGTSDGSFRNRRYFSCEPNSGVFVALDKITPQEDAADLKSRLKNWIPSFWKGKREQKSSQGKIDGVLKLDEKVVTFTEDDHPAKGTVRYIGEEKDPSGNVQIIVGLEMDERVGSGTGKRFGRQLFISKRDYAVFVPIETVIPARDFENPGQATRQGSIRNTRPKS